VPFLDHEMVEFAFTLPDKLKIKGFNTKRILRMALGDQIPHEILSRPKAGFPVPIRRWFMNDYYHTIWNLVMSGDSFCGQIFERKKLENYFTLHREGKYNCSDHIWTLGNLELWHRLFMQGIEPESINMLAQ
jgi:asparagine synthase (glutamine-hydrolysing)